MKEVRQFAKFGEAVAYKCVFPNPRSGVFALGGCGSSSTSAPTLIPNIAAPAPGTIPSTIAAGKVAHVVVVVQENRSFDNLFYGYPGADTATSGRTSRGASVPLHTVSMTENYDLSHELADYVASYNAGAMNGFDRGTTGPLDGSGGSSGVPADPQYAYVNPAQTATYRSLATSYVLADRFFPSRVDSSFTAHQYLIAAQAGGTVDNPLKGIPWGCDSAPGNLVPTLLPNRTDGPGIVPCFSYTTLADELDAAGQSWRYYAPAIGGDVGQIWSGYDAIQGIRYGSDWLADVITPQTRVLTDVAAGQLANVTWVVPDLIDSDHPASGSTSGPDWVASIVNAIGTSPFWQSTVIVVFWDDWGGWYDHVAPPQVGPGGLGFQTPMLLISPYAKHGYVSHAQYETGSVDRFIEGVFRLKTLAAADSRANGLDDCFDFTQASRTFTSFALRHSLLELLHRPPSRLPPDTD